jgi:flagellar hook-associated protein 3 FlgL
MQISTNLMFDKAISQMGKTKDRLGQVQLQLSTSKSVLKPSDSPDKTTTMTRLQTAITRQDSYVATIKTTLDKLSQQETALKSSSNILVRMKELAIQAANDTMSPQNRKEIAIEVAGLRDQVRSLANTQDVNGAFIFSGSRIDKPAYGTNVDGQRPYQGDQTIGYVPVGAQREVDNNRTGTQAFSRIIRTDQQGNQESVGFFKVMDDFVSALINNKPAEIQRSVGELDTAQLGMTESIANVGSGMNVLESQQAVAEENILRMKTTLSDVKDVDYTEAITQMNKDMLALEAAQSSFSKISQMNLFDYIR